MARLKVSEPVKGSLSLVGARLCRTRAELPAGTSVNSSPPHAHELFVVTTGRTLHLCGPSASDIAGWCSYLERAIEGRSSHTGAKVREVAARAGGPPRGTIAAATMSEAIVPRVLPSAVSVSAWVHKLNPDGHSWDSRWATLKPDALTFSYYVGPEKGDRCCRVVDLTYATLQGGCASPADPTADATLRRSPGFRLAVHATAGSRDPERTLVFVCPSFAEAQTWVDAIHTAMELGVPEREGVFKRQASAGKAATPTPRPPGAAAPTRRVPRLSELPVLQTTLFKSNPAGTKWGARTLVLVPHASKASFAPGVAPTECPCIAYYKGSDSASGPKGIINLAEVVGVAASAPQAVRRSAPGAYILTISTDDRAYYVSAKNEAELVRWRDAIFEVAEAWNNTPHEGQGARRAGLVRRRPSCGT